MPVETIAELIARLQRPGIDLFDQRRHRDAIVERGAPAIRDLLPLVPVDPPLLEGVLLETVRALRGADDRERARNDLEQKLAPTIDAATRKVCMRVLADQYPEATHVGQRLFDFVDARSLETPEVRLCALRAAGGFRPAPALGRRFLAALADPDADIVAESLRALAAYVGTVPVEDAVHALEGLLDPSTALALRCKAIDLLGRFGEIDALERVMLLPLTDPQEHAAVQSMVRHLLQKPRSVVRLAPKNFEHLVCRLLQKMKYEGVTVQRKGSWDEGVDVTAFCQETRLKGPERVKILGQCKRYQRPKLVGPDVIDSMVASLKTQEAARAVIITTSGFQPAATDKARAHRSIELIDGAQLQELLDRHFSPKLYRVLD